MSPEEIARKRLYEDFAFYTKHALRIRTKNAEVVPFELNGVQRRFHAAVEDQRRRTGKVRMVILKGRQQGFSTYVGARMYWRLSQRRARKGFVVAHKAESTTTLFDMYTRYHALVPALLKPSTKYSSRKELVFDKLDTGIAIATAGGDGIGRSETITDAHLSELAFWPTATAKDNLNGLLQTIPNTPDTEVFIESTANGFNEYETFCTEAMKGKNGFEFFFASWHETPEYRVAVPEGFERTIEEQELVEKYGLDDEQLQWRRQKISEGGRMKFMQEYPFNPQEAFIASGRPVFDPELINTLIEEARDHGPLYQMDVEETEAGMRVAKNIGGRLSVYRERDPVGSYVIGADVGMGIRDGDWSVAHILDEEKRVVGVWRGQVHPDYFADILAALGTYYNSALIAPERNAHGLLTCIRLWKDISYNNVFLDVTEGQTEDRDSINIGFLTTAKTRPLIIDRLRAALRERDITLTDMDTLQEAKTFIVNEAGKMVADAQCHDDTIMSLAIANHAHPGRFQPITFTDADYVTAI